MANDVHGMGCTEYEGLDLSLPRKTTVSWRSGSSLSEVMLRIPLTISGSTTIFGGSTMSRAAVHTVSYLLF